MLSAGVNMSVKDEVASAGYRIGAVAKLTGILPDTLRIWEHRYGFPRPVRNTKGERSYPEDQLRRLQRTRRLLDQGMRPGTLDSAPDKMCTLS